MTFIKNTQICELFVRKCTEYYEFYVDLSIILIRYQLLPLSLK